MVAGLRLGLPHIVCSDKSAEITGHHGRGGGDELGRSSRTEWHCEGILVYTGRQEKKAPALLVSDDLVGLHLDLLPPPLVQLVLRDFRVAVATVATRLPICTAPDQHLPIT